MTIRRERGFTLVELMVTVAVVAILTSISVGSYRSYLLRTHRTEASAGLLQIQVAQEKFFLQNNRYAGTAELTLAPPAGLGMTATTTAGGFFNLVITPAAPTTTFTATATATAAQIQDTDCAVFSINQIGAKRTTNSGGTDTTSKCWR